jgi:formate/nitrite transporter FocA (FNT family)
VDANRKDESATTPPGSEHLDEAEHHQAAKHAAPGAIVIHEIVRQDGEAELARRAGSTIWSGLAAGLSMGFSFLAMAMVHAGLSDTPSRKLIDSAAYSVGFIIVVLGRQELFTESTLTAVLPLLVRRNIATLGTVLRFWALVLSANIVGTFIFAALIAGHGIFADPVREALEEISREAVSSPFWPTLIKAVFAGWLIALMVWLLPSAGSARILVILLLTYVVAIGRFSHIIAGSVEGAFALFTGNAGPRDYLLGFFLPTIIGNTLGGVALVAMLNHAPLAAELQHNDE